jgi:hypothetical protein
MNYTFPLYSQKAKQDITLTTTTKEIVIDGRQVDVSVGASTAGVATLASVPVGLVFTLTGSNISPTGGASATFTTKAGKTITMTNDQTVTLMSIDNEGFTVMDATGVEGIARTATGTLFS